MRIIGLIMVLFVVGCASIDKRPTPSYEKFGFDEETVLRMCSDMLQDDVIPITDYALLKGANERFEDGFYVFVKKQDGELLYVSAGLADGVKPEIIDSKLLFKCE
jgi:hypothetical protein